VRDGDWKLIEQYEDGRVELYNLADDVAETQELSAREPGRAAVLRAALAAWRDATGAQTNSPNPHFQASLARPLYVEIDVSRFDPLRATGPDWERIWTWRKGLDAAVSTAPRAKP
jgi:hypothetical protein